MMRIYTLSAVAALAIVHSSLAAISVSSAAGTTSSVSGGDVTIDASAATQDVTITVTGLSSDFIGDIEVQTQSDSELKVTINVLGGGIPNIGVGGLQSLRRTSGAGELWIQEIRVAGEIGSLVSGETFGLVEANKIAGTIRALRNIYADIKATGTELNNPTPGVVIDTIEVLGGCSLCDVNDGVIFGSVFAFDGGIDTIEAINTIGYSAMPQIYSEGHIGSIVAGYLSGVDIEAVSSTIDTLEATDGGWGGDDTFDDLGDPIPGVMTSTGSVTASRIQSFQLKGDMASDLTVSSAPTTSSTWKIGGSLKSTGLMEFLQNNQLTHQIVFNEQAGADTWESGGQIKVGNSPVYTLNALYNTVPGSLGGGSAGAAPYQIHTKATFPEPSTTTSIGYLDYTSFEVPPPCINNFGVWIDYYGRIAVEGSAATAVTVWEGPKNWDGLDPLNPNSPVTTGQIVAFPVTASSGGSRRVTLTPSGSNVWSINKTYRVEVQANRLKNLDLINSGGGSPTYSPASGYWFKTSNGCEGMFDLNTDGSLNGADAATWLVEPVNFNQDNVPDVEDLDILLRGIDEHGGE